MPLSLYLAITVLGNPQPISVPLNSMRVGNKIAFTMILNSVELMNTDDVYLSNHNALILESINANILNQHFI